MGVHLSAASEGIADNIETEWSSPKKRCYYFPECITPSDLRSDQNYITTDLLNKY